jgi:hypothetical protein
MDKSSYLKDRPYYEDLYDRHTVERCRSHEEAFMENPKSTKGKQLTKKGNEWLLKFSLYFLTGERYVNRSKTIEEWMGRDRQRDEQFENALPPKGIRCIGCAQPMKYVEKMLSLGFGKDKDSMTFWFHCDACQIISKFRDGGKREDLISWQCPSCKKRLKEDTEKTQNKIITRRDCSFCGFTDEKILDLSMDPDEEIIFKDERRYVEDKLRFCLSDEEGQKYMRFQNGLAVVKEMGQKQDKEARIPKEVLTFPQIQKRLERALEDSGFERLEIGSPEMGRFVTASFNLQDEKGRESLKAKSDLKKLIVTALGQTNWNLMSDGISCRLGILTGRIRGLEEAGIVVDGEDVIF